MLRNDDEIKSILVTGGAGYIGSMLLRQLLNENYRVVCMDNLRFGGASLIDIWDHPNFVFKKGDITNQNEIDDIIDAETFFAVVHLAAIVGDPACKLEPELARKTNGDASFYLLDKAVEANIERFIFASTCSNYGKMLESGGFVNENSALAPVSLYAELKVEFENYILHKLKKRTNFCPTSLRFATVYGLSPQMRFDLTVNEFTKELALGKELVIFGKQFWRPYCYVGDLSRSVLTCLHAPHEKVAYEVFNVGDTNENYTKQMIVNELLRQIPQGNIKYVHKDEDPRDYRVNFDKIQKRLNFRISQTVPEGISNIYECLNMGVIDNPDDQKYNRS